MVSLLESILSSDCWQFFRLRRVHSGRWQHGREITARLVSALVLRYLTTVTPSSPVYQWLHCRHCRRGSWIVIDIRPGEHVTRGEERIYCLGGYSPSQGVSTPSKLSVDVHSRFMPSGYLEITAWKSTPYNWSSSPSFLARWPTQSVPGGVTPRLLTSSVLRH